MAKDADTSGRRAFRVALAALAVTAILLAVLLSLFGDRLKLRGPLADPALSYQRTLEQLHMPNGQWLSGFPSYASFSIPLPRDVDVERAEVRLRLSTDLSEKAVAILKISVNGQRAHEMVLQAGQTDYLFHFPVTANLQRQRYIRVGLALDGEVGDIVCKDDEIEGAVVFVRPDSAIDVTLKQPVYSVRDAMVLLPRDVVIALPEVTDTAGWLNTATALGVQLSHMGHDVTFGQLAHVRKLLQQHDQQGLIMLGDQPTLGRSGLAFSPEGLALSVAEQDSTAASTPAAEYRPDVFAQGFDGRMVLAVTAQQPHLVREIFSNPLRSLATLSAVQPNRMQGVRSTLGRDHIPLESLGVDTSVQQVSTRRKWSVDYAVADMPGSRIPAQLRFGMRLPVSHEDVVNIVSVVLNDHLIASRTIEDGDEHIMDFDLPRAHQKLRNRLEISLYRHRDEGGCDHDKARLPVQISSRSALILGSAEPDTVASFMDMPREFSAGPEVLVPQSYAQTDGADVLNTLLPVLAEFLPFRAEPQVRLLDPALTDVPIKPYFAYQFVPPGTGAVVYQSLKSAGGQRIVIDGEGRRVVQDMDLVNKAVAVERVVSRELIDEEREVYRYTHGLIVSRSRELPAAVHADFGHENVVVLPDRDDAVEVFKNGLVPMRRDVRTPVDGPYYKLQP